LAPPGQIGYRELPELTLREEENQRVEKQRKALEAQRARNAELIRDQSSRTKEPAEPHPDVELQRLKQDTKPLETTQGAKNRLDDRDEWWEKRDEAFKAKHVTPSPPPPHYIRESERTRMETLRKPRRKKVSHSRRPWTRNERRRPTNAKRRKKKDEQAKPEQNSARRGSADMGICKENMNARLHRRIGQQEVPLSGESGDNFKTKFQKGCIPTCAWKITQGT
jgi:hypothetical protein